MNDRRDGDGFDGVLSQMTERESSQAAARKTPMAPPPADRSAQPAAPKTASLGQSQDAAGAVRGARVPGKSGDTDSSAADAKAPSSNDDQAIAANLSWLLAGLQTLPPASVKLPADAGVSADQPGSADGKATEATDLSVASEPGSSAVGADRSGLSLSQVQAPPDQAANQIEDEAEAGAQSMKDPKPQRIDSASAGPSIVQVFVPQRGAVANPVGDSPAGGTPNQAPAVSAKARGLSALKVADASTGEPVDGKPAPAAADDVPSDSSKSGAAPAERTPTSWSASVSRGQSNAAGANGAADRETGKTAAPSPVAGPQASESRPVDARGSTRHDGPGTDEHRAEVPLLRTAGSPTQTHVFQMPMEMRTVGGVTLASGAVDAATAVGVPSGHEIDLPNQIVQAIRLQWNQGVGDARITLQPEYLGELSISIRVEHGAVSAELESSVPAVREWIDSHQPMLRQALSAQGLELQRLTTIDTPPASEDKRDGQSESHQQQEDRKQQRRRTRSDAPAFELIA